MSPLIRYVLNPLRYVNQIIICRTEIRSKFGYAYFCKIWHSRAVASMEMYLNQLFSKSDLLKFEKCIVVSNMKGKIYEFVISSLNFFFFNALHFRIFFYCIWSIIKWKLIACLKLPHVPDLNLGLLSFLCNNKLIEKFGILSLIR